MRTLFQKLRIYPNRITINLNRMSYLYFMENYKQDIRDKITFYFIPQSPHIWQETVFLVPKITHMHDDMQEDMQNSVYYKHTSWNDYVFEIVL